METHTCGNCHKTFNTHATGTVWRVFEHNVIDKYQGRTHYKTYICSKACMVKFAQTSIWA